MRWLNKYHRGFNRLWLVASIIGAFATVGFIGLIGGYQASHKPPEHLDFYFHTSTYRPRSIQGEIKKLVIKSWDQLLEYEKEIAAYKKKRAAKDKDKQSARKLRNEGMKIKDIASQLNLPPSLVRHWCKEDLTSDERLEAFGIDLHPIPPPFSPKEKILADVQSMAAARSFKKGQLEKMIDNAIEKEKQYQEWENKHPQRVWKARAKAVRDLLGAFIVTFAMGHGVFLVVWWIIRGFR